MPDTEKDFFHPLVPSWLQWSSLDHPEVKSQELYSGLLCGSQKPKYLFYLILFSPEYYKGTGSEVEQLRHELVTI